MLLQLLPIFIYFGLGLLVRRCGIAERTHGDFLLRFVFFVTLPLLIFTSVPNITFSAGKALLPFINVAVNLACLGAAYLWAKAKHFDRRTTGTVLVNTAIINNSFMFPFILAIYGQNGFADAILFDFGNALMMATFVYALAFNYSGEQHSRWTMLVRILKSPLVWSLVSSVLLAISGVQIPALVVTVIAPLAQMTGPLILIALGIFFSLKIANLPVALGIAVIRLGLGSAVGMLLATLLGLEGTTYAVIVLCCAGPIGFNALTYSSLAKLDVELSASAVSISILAGLIYIPVLIFLLGG
ncbi:MAG: AEC family transporter [Pseudomonadota bacterium]